MRERLLERDVELSPAAARADELYEGDGEAQLAWQAFRAVTTEPAYDPIRAWGEMQPVSTAGFEFEGAFSQGSRERACAVVRRPRPRTAPGLEKRPSPRLNRDGLPQAGTVGSASSMRLRYRVGRSRLIPSGASTIAFEDGRAGPLGY